MWAMPYLFTLLSLHLTALAITAHSSLHYNCPCFSLFPVSSNSPFNLQHLAQYLALTIDSHYVLAPKTVVSHQESDLFFFFYHQGLSHLCMPKHVILSNIISKDLISTCCCSRSPFLFPLSSFWGPFLESHS